MIIIEVRDHMSQAHLANDRAISLLQEFLRIETDYWARQNNPNIPRYKYLVSDDGEFLTGLLPKVVRIFKHYKIQYEIVDKRAVLSSPDISDVRAHLSGMRIDGNRLKLRDYQLDSLIAGLNNTRGIFDLATGAGKTVVMAALLLSWHKRALIVINSSDLANQLRDEIAEYTQQKVGFIGGGIWAPEDITVAIDRSLVPRSYKKKKRARKYMSEVEYLVFDEVHHIQSRTWQRIASYCSNASLRHGFSGTPETTEYKTEDGFADYDDLMRGYLGPVIARVTVRDLIEMGYLSDPRCHIIRNEVYFDSEPLDYSEEYERIIMNDPDRNRLITDIAYKTYQEGKQTIGFVTRIDHGETLRESLISDYGMNPEDVMFVHGESYDRKDQIEDFKIGDTPILFGTVLNEGLNFFCHVGINCSAGKNPKQVRQKIGRILRKPRTSTGDVDTATKRWVDFYDFYDRGHVWFRKHGRERVKVYRADGHQVDFIEPELILRS